MKPRECLGHFEIISSLGVGGMGEVYRAHDKRLDRDVAIKVLPAEVADDPERLARFEREAKVLASLNHQNIATLHGLEEHEGQRFLVMELVEGEDLATRIRRGPIPVEEALPIALQIAEGLEAAHERGIIHRDLKPANVMVAPEGKVKLLDFGLAKAWHGEASGADLADSPTLTAQMTSAGVILGTAAYMSPEQARGKPVDKRTDIWAFGCVLYEMFTGRPAFQGETVTDTLARVLEREPRWDTLDSSTPRTLQRLLRRCFAKDPHSRLHDIADARIVLADGVTEDPDGGADARRPGTLAATQKVTAIAAVAFLLGSAAAFVALSTWRRGDVPSRQARYELVVDSKRLSFAIAQPALAISPDGSHVVFSAEEDNGGSALYRRSFRDRVEAPIPGTEGAYRPFFSPDGQWLAFFADGRPKKMRIAGGSPEILCDAPMAYGGAWGPDGTIVFQPVSGESLWEVPESGGKATKLTAVHRALGEVSHWNPTFLPGGQAVLFGIFHGQGINSVGLLDLGARTHQVVLADASHAMYAGTGHLIFGRRDGLYALPFDLDSRAITGREFPLIRDLFVGPYDQAQFALSNTGILAYIPGTPQPRELVILDANGNVTETLPAPLKRFGSPRFSPDGTKIAVEIREPGTRTSWIVDRDSGRLTQIGWTGNAARPIWTPDGRRISYVSDRAGPGQWKIYWEAVGEAKGELLLGTRVSGRVEYDSVWTSDGRHLVIACNLLDETGDTAERGNVVAYLDLQNPGELTEVIPARHPMHRYDLAVSPDGRWLAYVEAEGERIDTRQVWVTHFPGGGGRTLVSKEGGICPRWSPDGNRIYFVSISGDRSMMVVDVLTGPELRVSRPTELFRLPEVGHYTADPHWDLSPDGRSFLTLQPVGEPRWNPPSHINVDEGFFEQPRDRAGARE